MWSPSLFPLNVGTEGTKINFGLTAAEEPREESGFQAVVAIARENEGSRGCPRLRQDTCPAPWRLRPASEPLKGLSPKGLTFSESRSGLMGPQV